ncbi:MAG TPA: dephospho-CoA kinase [Clostridiales bacterium]|nr:dephospho-CoA kinase [Clostridiales bacterium]
MNSYVVVGLTGPTGAGKSTVAGFFTDCGCDVIDCDSLGHSILKKGSITLQQLAYTFGTDVLDSTGNVNRTLLAQRAFSSRESTQRLNEICHPPICYKCLQMINDLRTSKENAVIILDAAVLLESNMDILCDTVICVTAPKAVRVQRIVNRDGITAKQAGSRISAQQDNDFYIERSDYCIDGNSGINNIKESVKIIYTQIADNFFC